MIIMSYENNWSCNVVLDLKKYNNTSKIQDQYIMLNMLK